MTEIDKQTLYEKYRRASAPMAAREFVGTDDAE
jgi:hypothetical protein